MPELIVVAGANGSGKTTLTSVMRKISPAFMERFELVNPDEIMFAECPGDPVLAGRIALQHRQRLLNDKRSFIIETTLSGSGEKRLMLDARKLGYKVVLVYIGLAHAGLNILRVASRVAAGGHDVPVEDIVRRRERSLANLGDVLAMVHHCTVLDNSGESMQRILTVRGSAVKACSAEIPDWVRKALPEFCDQVSTSGQ